MADRNLVLQLLITAKDQATSVFGKVFSYLDDNTKVIAGKIRDAFTGLFSSSIISSIDFEAALDRVQSKAKATEAEMVRLKQAALTTGREWGVSATSAAQALEILTGAGLSVDDAITALTPTLQVMKTEQVSADVAARALTDSLTVMGLRLTDTARAGDVMQAVADATSTSVTALAEAFRTGGAGAVSAGLSFEQTAVILAAFAKAGLQGSEAGTALKAIVRDLGDATGPARAELAKLGQTSSDVGQMIEVMGRAGVGAQKAVRAFSDEAQTGINALRQSGTTGLGEFTKAVDNASGGLNRAALAIQDNTLGALDQLKVAWDQLKLSLSGPLLEPIAASARAVEEQFRTLADSGVLEKIGSSIGSAFTEAGTAVVNFLKTVDWELFGTQASTAVTQIKTQIMEMVGDVQGTVQTVADWTTTIFSPVTASVDGLRIAWYLARGETEKAIAVQQRLEETNAAIGRALSGTSAQLNAATTATAAYAQQQAQLQRNLSDANAEVNTTRSALMAANDAFRNAQASGGDLDAAIKSLNLRAAEYRAALERQQAAQAAATASTQAAKPALENLKPAADTAKAGLDALNPPLKETTAHLKEIAPAADGAKAGIAAVGQRAAESVPHLEKGQAAAGKLGQGFYEIKPGSDAASGGLNAVVDSVTSLIPHLNEGQASSGKLGAGFYEIAPPAKNAEQALLSLQKPLSDNRTEAEKLGIKTNQLTAEIGRVGEASAGWNSGMELNVITLNSLRNVSDLAAQKVAVLEERQRAGEKLDREIAAAKQAASQALDRYNLALGENIQQQERAVVAAQRATALGQQENDIMVRRAQSALELARIKGDSNKIQQAENDLIDAEIGKLNQAIASKVQEVEAYDALIDATRRKMEANGELDADEQAVLATMADKKKALELEQQALAESAQSARDNAEATREKAEADREAAEAAKAAAEADAQRKAAGEAVTDVMNKEIAAIRALGGDTEALTARFNELQRQFSNDAMTSITDWMGRLAGATRQVKQEFEAQKGAAENLIERYEGIADGTEAATYAQIQLGKVADSTNVGFGLLNEQDLSRLRAAIDSANAKLRQMKEETQDARMELKSLNAELLEEQGLDEKAEKLRAEIDYQERLADIEQRRREAELMGNKELAGILSEQAATLRQIYSAKLANIEADKTAETAGDKTAKGWNRAEEAIRGAGAALKDVHGVARGVAEIDLSGLNTQMNNLAAGAERLRSVL